MKKYLLPIALSLSLLSFFSGVSPVFADDTFTTDTSHASLSAGFGYSAADGSAQYAMQFTTVGAGTISSITVSVNKIGTPGDSPKVGIEADSSGVPSNTYLSSNTFTVSQSNPTCTGTQTVSITPVSVTAATKYWIVWSRTGALDLSNRYGLCGSGGVGTNGDDTNGTAPNNWSAGVGGHTNVWATLTVVAAAAAAVTPSQLTLFGWL